MRQPRAPVWTDLVRAFLAHRYQVSLDKAIQLTADSDLRLLLESFSCRDETMLDQVEAFLEERADFLDPVEKQVLNLMCLDLQSEWQETFEQHPSTTRKEVLQAGVDACQEAVRIAEELGDDCCIAFYLYSLGRGFAAQHAYEEAEIAYSDALVRWLKHFPKKPSLLASDLHMAWNNLGFVLRKQGLYEEAEVALSEALALVFGPHGDELSMRDTAVLLAEFGYLHADEGRFDHAESALRAAANLYDELSQEEPNDLIAEYAAVCMTFGDLLVDQAFYEEGERVLRKALTLCKRLYGDQPEEYDVDLAEIWSSLGSVLDSLARYSEAESAYEEALSLYNKRFESQPLVYVLNLAEVEHNLSLIHLAQGRYTEAESVLRRTLSFYRQLSEEWSFYVEFFGEEMERKHRTALAIVWNNLGNIYWYQDRFEQARDALEVALHHYEKLYRDEPDVYAPDVAMSLANLANVLDEMEALDEAESMIRRAKAFYLDLYDAQPHVYASNLADIWNNEGNLFQKQGHLEKAEAILLQSLQAYQELHQTQPQTYAADLALVWHNVGTVLQERSLSAEAQDAYQHAIALDPHVIYAGGRLARWRLGEIHRSENQLKSCYHLWSTVLSAIEEQRATFMRKEDRGLPHNDYAPLYDKMVALCLGLNRPAEAWHWVERGKARTLLDQLGSTPPRLENERQRTLYDRWQQAERAVAWLIYHLNTTVVDEKARIKKSHIIDEKRAEALELRKSLTFEWEAASNHVAVKVPSPETLAQYLQTLTAGERTMLVQYALLDENQYVVFLLPLWEVASDRSLPLIAQQVRLPPGKIEQLSRQFQAGMDALQRGDTSKANAQMSLLPEVLGESFLQPWQHHLDQFQPDNVAFIPGGALHRMPLHAALFKNGQPFIERYPALYLGSAAIAQTLASRLDTAPRPTERLVLGPPHPPEHPLYREYAHREAAYLAAAWQASHFAFSQMQTDRLRERAGRLQVLHLATHSHFDEADYLQSHLQFYHEHLSVFELISDVHLDFRGMRLCYLSSCEAGVAHTGRAEDLQGLVWALMYAGAEAVMASLWPVDDTVAEWMARGVYRRLHEGRSLVNAYADTLCALRHEDDFANPLYWAPFVLFGNGFTALMPI